MGLASRSARRRPRAGGGLATRSLSRVWGADMHDRRVRVLLVEDDEDDYLLTRDLLAEIPGPGFDLDWMTDFDDALAAIGRDRHDVALIDYRLAGRDGLELVRAAIGRGCTAPLILLT